MSGAGAVVALVLVEWAAGLVVVAGWSQSWSVVRRGHFRIVAWCAVGLGALAFLADRAVETPGGFDEELQVALAGALCGAIVLYALAQYVRSDKVGVAAAGLVALVGLATVVVSGSLLDGWDQMVAAWSLGIGALFLGAVTNGMLLGHWYLNQPGLKPWALERLTWLSLGATAAAGLVGLANVRTLAGAETRGAVLGLPGFGDSFGPVFFGVWLVLVVFTGVIVYLAFRCIKIRSIQSATGLYYVALLTAGVAEFLVRYLMVNA